VNTDINASKPFTTAALNEPDLEGELNLESLLPDPLGASSTSRELPARSTLLSSDPYYKPPRRQIVPLSSPHLPPTPSLQPLPDPIMSRPSSPSTPAPVTHSHSGVKFNPPTAFDGSFKDYKRFMRELLIFLTGHKINDDATKIAVALSFMRGGYAEEFVQETINLASVDPTDLDWGSWTDFKARLDARFKDKNFSQTAREKLEHFQQGKQLVDTYISQLESLFTDAGLVTVRSFNPAVIAANAAIDAEKIRILEKSVGSNILETIYSSDNPIPTTYDAYKDKILQLGRMRERYRQFRNITSSTSSSTTTHAPKPAAAQFHTHIHPPADKKTGTGITYGGAGQPMEIGKTRQQIRCFNCGEFGHMRRDCPKEKKIDIRALIAGLEEELAELRVEAENGESDFMDGR
jgi:hypothetical protein